MLSKGRKNISNHLRVTFALTIFEATVSSCKITVVVSISRNFEIYTL